MHFDGILTDRPTVTQRDEVSRSVTLPWMGWQSAQGRLAVVFSGVSECAELDFEGIRTR